MQEAKKSFILSVADRRGERCGVTSAAQKDVPLLTSETLEGGGCCGSWSTTCCREGKVHALERFRQLFREKPLHIEMSSWSACWFLRRAARKGGLQTASESPWPCWPQRVWILCWTWCRDHAAAPVGDCLGASDRVSLMHISGFDCEVHCHACGKVWELSLGSQRHLIIPLDRCAVAVRWASTGTGDFGAGMWGHVSCRVSAAPACFQFLCVISCAVVASAEMKLQASYSSWRRLSLYKVHAGVIYIARSWGWRKWAVAFFSVVGECLDVWLELKAPGAHHICSALQLVC